MMADVGGSAGTKVLFVYLGRRGALSQFVMDLAAAAGRGVFVVSRQNESYADIVATGATVVGVDTFTGGAEAILRLGRLRRIRRVLAALIAEHRVRMVVNLMSHVWSPFLVSAVRKSGARYLVVAHDAVGHPGDRTGLLTNWLLRDALRADRIVTLSGHVRDQLAGMLNIRRERIAVLFHPVMGRRSSPRESDTAVPVRFVFFGRIMAYKGLPLFVEASERLRREGLRFGIGVVGEGDISPWRARLDALGAEVVNRWVSHDELTRIVETFDAVVVPSIEASQSGVVALAQGIGLPAIVTPVGGLPEQVGRGETGLVAASVSAAAVADEMRRFLTDASLRRDFAARVRMLGETRSMSRFFQSIANLDEPAEKSLDGPAEKKMTEKGRP